MPVVLSRARDLGIPMILVDKDTYSAVDQMEALIGHVRMHEDRRVKHMCELLKTHASLGDLFEAIGLSSLKM